MKTSPAAALARVLVLVYLTGAGIIVSVFVGFDGFRPVESAWAAATWPRLFFTGSFSFFYGVVILVLAVVVLLVGRGFVAAYRLFSRGSR